MAFSMCIHHASRRHLFTISLLLVMFVSFAKERVYDDDDQLLERILARQARANEDRRRTSATLLGEEAAMNRKRRTKAANMNPHQYKKESTDRESLKTQAIFQEAQRQRIRAADREGKEDVYLLRAQDRAENMEFLVDCDIDFYSKAYGIIDKCTPVSASSCRRIVRDDFATTRECKLLLDATEVAMKNLFHRGGSTSLAPVHGPSAERLGVKGKTLFDYLINKIRLQVMQEFDLDFLYNSGALLTRLKGEVPKDDWEMDPNHIYWNAHVDKANIPTYDYSALLYLNDCHEDFEGGEFEFIDDDVNRVVEPRAGRLLLFTSGPENLHRVRKVTEGTRYVLAMWFTCSAIHQYQDDEPPKSRKAEQQAMALRAENEDLIKANKLLAKVNEKLQKDVEQLAKSTQQCRSTQGQRSAAGSEEAKKSKGGREKEMLEDMAIKRRLAAEVEFAKKRLAAAKEAASSSKASGKAGTKRCFDVESCSQEYEE
mmetsp:Transcript_32871/g.103950  ORF Transcript_32871/g.103950 Transcript_32871/m.103950 type:complete len:485 (-) Transcript_32871:1177-2631(-)